LAHNTAGAAHTKRSNSHPPNENAATWPLLAVFLNYPEQFPERTFTLRTAYKVVAHIIAIAVVIQAALIAWALFGLIPSLQAGILPEGPPLAAIMHGMIGTYGAPILVLALLVIALLAHAGLKWALWLVLAVAVQITLAFVAFDASWVGLLHGANAFAIIALAEVGARAVAHAPAHAPSTRKVMRPAT
jgi:hypothetical protein